MIQESDDDYNPNESNPTLSLRDRVVNIATTPYENENALTALIASHFRPDNVGFIQAAMELGIVGDALIISPGNNDAFEELDDYQGIYHYRDFREQDHRIYHTCYFTELIEGHALLVDRRPPCNRRVQETISTSQIILDIDLDYFTFQHSDETYPISEEAFQDIFSRIDLLSLVPNIAFFTIALEPRCCGRNPQYSEIIYQRVRELLFHLDD